MPYKDLVKRKEYHKEYQKTYKPNLKRVKYTSMCNRVKNEPAYKNVSICPLWSSDRNAFYDWLENEFNEIGLDIVKDYDVAKTYHLDKDYSGAKMYSPSTCILIPQKLNALILNSNDHIELRLSGNWSVRVGDGNNKRLSYGTYSDKDEAIQVGKEAKLNTIKQWTDKYHKSGKISNRAYQVIMNYINKNK